MASFDQKNQKVNTSYNAENMHFYGGSESQTSKNSKSVPTDIDGHYGWAPTGSSYEVSFTLNSRHVVRYKREDRPHKQTVHLYLDGKEIVNESVGFPFAGSVNRRFEIEGVDCLFSCTFFVLGANVKLEVGGVRVFTI